MYRVSGSAPRQIVKVRGGSDVDVADGTGVEDRVWVAARVELTVGYGVWVAAGVGLMVSVAEGDTAEGVIAEVGKGLGDGVVVVVAVQATSRIVTLVN
jgi:hypothetical protein